MLLVSSKKEILENLSTIYHNPSGKILLDLVNFDYQLETDEKYVYLDWKIEVPSFKDLPGPFSNYFYAYNFSKGVLDFSEKPKELDKFNLENNLFLIKKMERVRKHKRKALIKAYLRVGKEEEILFEAKKEFSSYLKKTLPKSNESYFDLLETKASFSENKFLKPLYKKLFKWES